MNLTEMCNAYDIAKDCWRVCYDFAMSKESETYYFHGKENLEGMCAIASFFLRNQLKRNGFNTTVVVCKSDFIENSDHCWVSLDEMVLDITAKQFGFKDVEFRASGDPYCGGEIVKRMSRFAKWCIVTQRPTRNVLSALSKKILV